MRDTLSRIITDQWFAPKNSSELSVSALGIKALTAIANCVTEPLLKRRLEAASDRKRGTNDFSPPVIIVVGNLVVGGAGKTPLVAALAKLLAHHNYKVGLIVGGYKSLAWNCPALAIEGSTAEQIGDEALLLTMQTGLPLASGRDRTKALNILINSNPQLNVILCDDGLQHRGLTRDVEIVVFDDRLIGNGKVLPSGPLREPLGSLQSADFIAIAKGTKDALVKAVGTSINPKVQIVEQGWKLRGFIKLQAYLETLDQRTRNQNENENVDAALITAPDMRAILGVSKETAIAAAGLGNPAKFFKTLLEAGINALPYPLPDHQAIKETWLVSQTSKPIIMTEKDAVKCGGYSQRAIKNCWVTVGEVAIDERFSTELLDRLNTLLKRKLNNH